MFATDFKNYESGHWAKVMKNLINPNPEPDNHEEHWQAHKTVVADYVTDIREFFEVSKQELILDSSDNFEELFEDLNEKVELYD